MRIVCLKERSVGKYLAILKFNIADMIKLIRICVLLIIAGYVFPGVNKLIADCICLTE